LRVVVAMSGGVDSSVVAALMAEQGHEVIGVHMRLHDASPTAVSGHCCGYDDAMDARRVATQLDIPFYVLDLRDAFQKAVMQDFADTYLAGGTPNPCIRCNAVLKFKVLMKRAIFLGADALATGHYARIVETPDGPMLAKALDTLKDQSYFLFPLDQEALEATVFPLGAMTKQEVRELAQRFDLLTAEKPESQEVCFLPDDNHARFVGEQHEDVDASGEIVDEDGRVLGFHSAYYKYTVGQRRGLGIALGTAAYVTRVDAETRRVVVSTDENRLMHKGLVLGEMLWVKRPGPHEQVGVRIRHRGEIHPCTVDAGDAPEVRFEGSARAVAPGQAAVFYDGEQVLGGGWIVQARDAQRAAAS
jgi:tRNA-specific 2-thiouridylase